jgi:protein-S-isoprenylcysteine O-methyltransferase Ste14
VGVYGIVRHPMYLGATLLVIGTPLLLGSIWGLAIGIGLTLLLIMRIFSEERLLVRELDGYVAYRHEVRYRLLPGIW